jgi:anti-sigma regulatory factor (Ser/Thr protein kinase)
VIESRSFPHSPASVSGARRFVLEAIEDESASISEAAAIVVSELATNCVRHAGTGFTVDVETTPTRLRVAVSDEGGGTPAPRSPEPSEPTGRGLLLVRELSDEWGIASSGDRAGKSVWFTMALSAASDRAMQDAD